MSVNIKQMTFLPHHGPPSRL